MTSSTEGLTLKILPKPETQESVSLASATGPAESIHRVVTEDGIAVLVFDRPDSPVNLFDRATLLELNGHLNYIACQSHLRGLVLTSAKKSVFIAGADISAVTHAKPSDVNELLELGQTVFDRIAALLIPTVAAIHGACVGGGFEIVLACNYRIASPDRCTKIGLPEVQLGILPAWGGSTRLPRLIGLPAALDIILAGKTLAAKAALKRGMIDDVVPKEHLLEFAKKKILQRGDKLRHRKDSWAVKLTNNALVARLLAHKVRQDVLKKTRGHYPAAIRALEVVTAGVSTTPAKSLALERKALLELGQTEVCRNLVRVFFLQERAKKIKGDVFAAPAPAGTGPTGKPAPVERLAVIGAGVMGAGIAQWVSAKEYPTLLRDINLEAVGKGLATIAKLYDQGMKRRSFSPVEARAGMDRVTPVTAEVPLTHVDLVIEAAVERMDLKKDLFRRLDAAAGPQTILATNTSALSITEIAQATQHPERVIGIHFFNPVHRMQLVEVVVGAQTSTETVRRSVKFVQQIGKLPVVVKDSPGFLVNRILMPYLVEAGHLFETGARVEDIDEAMLEYGMPMGPLRLIDEVGVDVARHVAATLTEKFGDRLTVPRLLDKMIEAKWLGKKSGTGFYLHPKSRGEPRVNSAIDKLHAGASSANLSREELQTRMVLLMVNEAARCLEEKIVAEPADVDFGMIMGTGFAPFLGGPLRFADFAGIDRIVKELKELAQKEPRFLPCGLLQSLAASGRKFYEN